MNKIVAVSVAAAVPTIAPAEALQAPDPIFAALDAFRSAEAEFYADHDGDIPDEVGDRWTQAVDAVIRTQPTTPAGLGALTSFARDMIERSDHDATVADDQLVPIIAAIDDATRGMSGLKPWEPAVAPVNPDAKLVELGREFERLLAIEEPLQKEHARLSSECSRLHSTKLAYDPDDHEAKRNIAWDDWNNAWKEADEETGRHAAYDKWNKASMRTAKIGKKILKLAPKTTEGFLIRVRVIETHDEIGKMEPVDQLLAEIRNFAKLAA